MNLIIGNYAYSHVSADTIMEFENAILSSDIQPVKFYNRFTSSILKYELPRKVFHRLVRLLPVIHNGENQTKYFSVFMGLDPIKSFPYFFFPGRKSIYLFDAWPDQHITIAKFLNKFNVEHAFISSSQATEQLQKLVRTTKCHWIPEGVDVTQYKFKPYSQKDIDVLSVGRGFNRFDCKQISEDLRNKYKFMYEVFPGQIVFPTGSEFINGLARAKISICFPASMTNNNKAKGIETMTIRYLQAMASKCLIVGHAPKEMIELFGYNPVIEIDLRNTAGEVAYILENYQDFTELIESNYHKVQNHTWNKRWAKIVSTLNIN